MKRHFSVYWFFLDGTGRFRVFSSLMREMCAKAVVAFVTMAVAAAQQSGSKPQYFFFRSMEIDPVTLATNLIDGISGNSQPNREFFAPFRFQTGNRVDQYIDKQRYNCFIVAPSGKLLYRTKYQELISGSFGAVYSISTFYYRDSGSDIAFEVRPSSKSVPHELPQVNSSIPPDGCIRLDAISIIRVVALPQGFIIAVGEYSPEGYLDNVTVDGAMDGDWIHQNRLDELDKSLHGSVHRLDDSFEYRNKFGFRRELDVADLIAGRKMWDATGYASVVTTVNFHYDRNRCVQQNTLAEDGIWSRRFLTYRYTFQDRTLDVMDRGLPFGFKTMNMLR